MRLVASLVLMLAVGLGPAGAVADPGARSAGSGAQSAGSGAQSADPGVQATDPELEAEVRDLASRLRCPTCRALSVYDSPSEIAREMRDVIREQLRAGSTPAEVEAYFVERYGEWILLEPRASGFNWSVWLLPAVVLLGGIAFVLLTARRWVERGRAAAADLADDEELLE